MTVFYNARVSGRIVHKVDWPCIATIRANKIYNMGIFENLMVITGNDNEFRKFTEYTSGRRLTHDFSHGSPILNQLSHRCVNLSRVRDKRAASWLIN